MEVLIENVEDGLEVVVHQQDYDSDASTEECEFHSNFSSDWPNS